MFSNHVENSAVTDSEFKWTGDSAVAFLGSTISIDGSAPTYPNKNLVARNHMHEVGIYGKQMSTDILKASMGLAAAGTGLFVFGGVNSNGAFPWRAMLPPCLPR
jgi:hypothetical protein